MQLLAVLCLALSSSAPDSGSRPLSVLFIGNSYTYFNNLPGIFEKIVSPQRSVITEMQTVGGMTLEGQASRREVAAALRRRKWDFVVLQEQSSLTNDFYANGVARVTDPAPFWHWTGVLARRVRAVGAKPVLYMTWKRKHAPARDALFLDYAYSAIGRKDGCLVAPAGRAWKRFLERNPNSEIYYRDGSHPDELGTYISATTLAKTIAGIDLRRLPAKFVYRPVDLDTEKVGTKTATLSLSPRQVREVRLAVTAAIAEKAPSPPGPLEEPSVRPGALVAVGQLSGAYAGQLRLFTEKPLGFWVQFDDQGAGIATIPTGPKDPGISSAIHVTTRNGILSFTLADPGGRYNFVFRAACSEKGLDGISELRYTKSFTDRSELGTSRGKANELFGFGPWSAGR